MNFINAELEKLINPITFKDFSYLGSALKKSLGLGVKNNVQFRCEQTPKVILRDAVRSAIVEIEIRGEMLRRFLKLGPYEDKGKIPKKFISLRCSDDETMKVISFIYSSMVNSFQGRLAEMLSIEPVIELQKILFTQNKRFQESKLFFGDIISVEKVSSETRAKGADFYLLQFNPVKRNNIILLGVGEIKSYHCALSKLNIQLEKHITRAKKGLYIDGKYYSVTISPHIKKIFVLPETWKLTRKFYFSGFNNNLLNMEFEKLPKSKNSMSEFKKIIGLSGLPGPKRRLLK